MPTRIPTLSATSKGNDVKRLHDALAVIGHAVAPGDAKQERFGSSTKGAVQRLQKALGLPTTGEVDEATAERLSRIDQAKPRPLSTQPATTEFPGRARIRGTTPTPREIRAVQKVLASLGHAIPASDISKGEVSGVTLDALHALQDATGTTRSDNLDAMTLALVNTEAHHAWFVRSRTRVARVQDLLAAVGYEVPEDERETRTLGTQSRAALAAFRSARGLPPIARVDEATYAALEDQALRFRLSSKRQVGLVQHKLHRLAGALKLPTRIDPAELRSRDLGPTSEQLVKELQKRSKLPETGHLDPATMQRIDSVLAARFPERKALARPKAPELQRLTRTARLNATGAHVRALQLALAFHGHSIDQVEFTEGRFGASTRKAVLAFQVEAGLPANGHADKRTSRALNDQMAKASKSITAGMSMWRVRGCVRGEDWKGIPDVVVEVFERAVSTTPVKLAEKKTGPNGFFDLPYTPPRRATDGEVQPGLQVEVRWTLPSDLPQVPARVLRARPVAWANVTLGEHPYQGRSTFEDASSALRKVLGADLDTALKDIQDFGAVQTLAARAGLPEALTAEMVVAHACERLDQIKGTEGIKQIEGTEGIKGMQPEVVFAFLRGGIPSSGHWKRLIAGHGWDSLKSALELVLDDIARMDKQSRAQVLAGARSRNDVPIRVTLKAASVADALARACEHRALHRPLLDGKASLGPILAQAGVPETNRPAVAEAWLSDPGFGPGFWSNIRKDEGTAGGPATVARLGDVVTLAQATDNDLDAVDRILAVLDDPADDTLTRVSDIARKHDLTWWEGVLGGSESTRRQRAQDARRRSAGRFPAIALLARVDAPLPDALPDLHHLKEFFDARPDLDLRTTSIDHALQGDQDTLPAPQRAQARLVQHVLRLGQDPDVAHALLTLGLHSPWQVLAMGEGHLVAELRRLQIKDHQRIARTVFGRAESQHADALALLMHLRDARGQGLSRAMGAPVSTGADPTLMGQIPDIEALFGSLDSCACEHCASVLSPAAYLWDLLRYLGEQRETSRGRSARDVLLARRPDIARIELSCANSLTPLPHIDLVCEILEDAVVRRPPPTASSQERPTYQTAWSAADLSAGPEHLDASAYDALRVADWPMLPTFDLWEEETRAFLRRLGVQRADLMELLDRTAGQSGTGASRLEKAAERLGISSHEASLIVTPQGSWTEQKRFWGEEAGGRDTPVLDLMRAARLEYTEVLDLVATRWASGDSPSPPIELSPLGAGCDIGTQTVLHLTPTRLDRVHRFLRLWRHLGWTMWELDLVLRVIAGPRGELDGQVVESIAELQRLRERLGLDVEGTLAALGHLDLDSAAGSGRHTLYQRLFQEQAAARGLPDPEDLVGRLSDELMLLSAALRLPAAEVAQLADFIGDQLDAAHLSALVALVSVGRGLRLPTASLCQLIDLQDEERGPFATRTPTRQGNLLASPSRLRAFIELADQVAASPFDVAELAALLKGPSQEETHADSDLADQLRDRLGPLDARDRVVAAAATLAGPFALEEDAVRSLLAGLRIRGQDLAAIVESEPKTWDLGAVRSAISLLRRVAILVSRYELDDPDAAVRLLASTHRPAEGADVNGVRPDSPEGRAILHLANTAPLAELDIEAGPASQAARSIIEARPIPSLNALDKVAFVDPTAFGHLVKYVEEKRIEAPGLLALPGASGPLEEWRALDRWMLLRRSLRGRTPGLDDAVAAAAERSSTSLHAFMEAVAGATGWSVSDLQKAHGLLELQQAAQSGYQYIETLIHIQPIMELLRKLKVDLPTAQRWATRPASAAEARKAAIDARQATRARYANVEWNDLLASIQGPLRERRRDALVNWLIEHSRRNEPVALSQGRANPRYWERPDDLYQYFLIDTQLSACQLTSRVKQAISAVQTFVQRCFLNLEQPDVRVSREERQDKVSDNSWAQWRWMKSYRVWEANRKVFLYPENWLEPELRDDRSQFFQELENELLAGDITDERAEAALRRYLEKLDEVANLDIVGMYHEVSDDHPWDDLPPTVDRVHVIGRTRAVPHTYYHRWYDQGYDRWTGWERVDLDIEGDHLIPVVYNRRLHLFWLIFHEKAQKVEKQPEVDGKGGDSPQPPTMIEVQLAWSQRSGDGWSPKRVSTQRLVHPWPRPAYSYHFKPRYKKTGNELWLDVFISTSVEFNGRSFWDQYSGRYQRLTKIHPAERGLPWHSSSFVFDGNVRDVRLRPLAANYHIKNGDGVPANPAVTTDSYKYLLANFSEQAGDLLPLSNLREIAPRLVLPEKMHYRFNRLVGDSSGSDSGPLVVTEHGKSRTLLGRVSKPFSLVFSQHEVTFDTLDGEPMPMVFQDGDRAFVIHTSRVDQAAPRKGMHQAFEYRVRPFSHPFTKLFLRELGRGGVDALMSRRLQLNPQTYQSGRAFHFDRDYVPLPPVVVDDAAKNDTLDFTPQGAYALYNWELFFHVPYLIACRLSHNQRFDEAMRWFHFIFDPTSIDGVDIQRFWNTRPFHAVTSEAYRAQALRRLIEDGEAGADAVRAWKNDPFKPHLVARDRPVAYQRAVVIKYIENLIAWGDQLFRRETLEALNEATMLYVLAAELLGRRPVKVPTDGRQPLSDEALASTANGTRAADSHASDFGRLLSTAGAVVRPGPQRTAPDRRATEPLPLFGMPYFCLPANEALERLWDTVDDRLFKLRHCMSIEGVVRQLPLFEPPIDPALLIRATTLGLDIGSVLAGQGSVTSHFRFPRLIAVARDFAGQVSALGQSLLSLLEKRDGERLSQLRASQERELLEATTRVMRDRVKESSAVVESLQHAKAAADKRYDWFSSREFMSAWEKAAMVLTTESQVAEGTIAMTAALGAPLRALPGSDVGVAGAGGSPKATVKKNWGQDAADAVRDATNVLTALNAALRISASLTTTLGAYHRRKDEWDLQTRLAVHEQRQREKDILAAEIRLAIAERELALHEQRVDHAEQVEAWMKDKFTNDRLYDWMVREVSTVYLQAYQVAVDMARRARASLVVELGDEGVPLPPTGHWDSLKKGLLAGERLGQELRRLEVCWIEKSERELELVKHVSLARLDPVALLQLRLTGECHVDLPEWLFDKDYPGHYRRRIKSVALTIPAVTGPYTNVNCTLELSDSRIRREPGRGRDLWEADAQDAVVPFPPVRRMATSHGRMDAGLFQLRFDDERFLPFEGAGAVSKWTLSLPQENNQFDLQTVSDVIMHVQYTARRDEGSGESGEAPVLPEVNSETTVRLFSLRQDFPDQWAALTGGSHSGAALELALSRDQLPYVLASREEAPQVSKIECVVQTRQEKFTTTLTVTPPDGAEVLKIPVEGPGAGSFGQAPHGAKEPQGANPPFEGTWVLQFSDLSPAPANVYLLVHVGRGR